MTRGAGDPKQNAPCPQTRLAGAKREECTPSNDSRKKTGQIVELEPASYFETRSELLDWLCPRSLLVLPA